MSTIRTLAIIGAAIMGQSLFAALASAQPAPPVPVEAIPPGQQPTAVAAVEPPAASLDVGSSAAQPEWRPARITLVADYGLVIGVSQASIPGKTSFLTRGTATLWQWEIGELSGAGRGSSLELRAVEGAWLAHDTETRVRIGLIGVGAKYRLVTLFSRTRGERVHVHDIGSPGGAPVQYSKWQESMNLEWLGLGGFARANVLSWTYLEAKASDRDPVTIYDPWVEAGLFGRLAIPVQKTVGIDLSCGGAASLRSGLMLFVRLEMLLLGPLGLG